MLVYSAKYKHVVEALKSKGWENEVLQKYLKYLSSKDRVIQTGRTSTQDSGRGKTYKAEWKFQAKFKYQIKDFDTEKQARSYMNRVLKSKLWAEVCGGVAKKPELEVVGFRGRTAGRAYGWKIQLCATNGMDQYTLLHELAHVAGHMHHDVSFRQCLLKLTSRFIGRDAAKYLKQCFREQKLKMNVSTSVKSPEQWLEGYNRLAAARKCL